MALVQYLTYSSELATEFESPPEPVPKLTKAQKNKLKKKVKTEQSKTEQTQEVESKSLMIIRPSLDKPKQV